MVFNHNKLNYIFYKPKKKLSQNFLRDDFIIKTIVAAIKPHKDHDMIEIGPGLGALTWKILEKVDKLTVIELDKELVSILKRKSIPNKKLDIFQQNVLDFDFSSFAKNKKLLRIFGNLPYHISTNIVIHLFNHLKFIKDMHLMFQEEVADRLTAKPKCRNYGRISILAQYHCQITKILNVSSASFQPKPKVNSIFLRLIPHKNIIFPVVQDVKKLQYITAIAFSKRRKMIHNSLNKLFNKDILKKMNINEKLRAEDISILQYCKLAKILDQK